MKAQVPLAAQKKLARLLRERVRIEQRWLARGKVAIDRFGHGVRSAFAHLDPAGPYSVSAHARALRPLRAATRAFGLELSHLAQQAAHEAATLGAKQEAEALAIIGGAALGRRVLVPTLGQVGQVKASAASLAAVNARTEEVGAAGGERLGAMAAGMAYQKASASSSTPTAVVASVLALALMRRAKADVETVIITETHAAANIGGTAFLDEFASQLVEKPSWYRVWDGVLDAAICPRCLRMHGRVAHGGEPFEGGIIDPPLHPRCRCATWPWFSDWDSIAREIDLRDDGRMQLLQTVARVAV